MERVSLVCLKCNLSCGGAATSTVLPKQCPGCGSTTVATLWVRQGKRKVGKAESIARPNL